MNAATRPRRWRDVIALFAFAILLTLAAWAAGFATSWYLGPSRSAPPVPAHVAAPPGFALFGEAWGYVDREFYGERPAPAVIARDAIEGMVEAVDDRYAAYVPPDGAPDAARAFLPEFGASLGAWTEPVVNGVLVSAVVPASPAAVAALAPGEVIVAAGGESLFGLSRTDAGKRLAGADGSKLALVVLGTDGRPRAVDITRHALAAPTVSVDASAPAAPVVRIGHLAPAVLTALDRAWRELGGGTLTSLVLDLRDNPGGDLDSLRSLAGRFFDGDAWIAVDRDGKQTPEPSARGDAVAFALPPRVVVLVNEGTAGAAEMLAAGLRDHLGATLVGTHTFGRGTLQTVRPLTDGALVRLTTGHWLTPKGVEVDGVGLTPDKVVDGADAQRAAALDLAARGGGG
jgi:carboxyl-terminal processing protease